MACQRAIVHQGAVSSASGMRSDMSEDSGVSGNNGIPRAMSGMLGNTIWYIRGQWYIREQFLGCENKVWYVRGQCYVREQY